MNSFLAVDIGTTLTKGIILTEKGKITAKCEINRQKKREINGTHENDAEIEWWNEFITIVKALRAQDNNSKISIISISGMWPNFLLLDKENKPLYPAILYDDPRSIEYCLSIQHFLGSNLYGYEVIPRILWFKNIRPDLWHKANSFLTTHSYIAYKLTGIKSIDSHTALSLGNIFDPNSFQWNHDFLNQFEISSHLFPSVSPPSEIIGYLNLEASKILELPIGIPVIAGFGDTFSSFLGSGCCEIGDKFLYLGSTGTILEQSQKLNVICGGTSYSHEDEGVHWIATFPRYGEKLSKVAQMISPKLEFDKIDSNNLLLKPGSDGIRFLYESERKSKFSLGKENASLIYGIKTTTDPVNIYHSALESYAFNIKSSIDNDFVNSPIYITGGGARSEIFRSILTHVLKRQIVYLETSQYPLGSAILAAYSFGIDIIKFIVEFRLGAIRSDPSNVNLCEYYDELFEEYNSIQKIHLHNY